MVIGVYRFLSPHCAAEDFNSAIDITSLAFMLLCVPEPVCQTTRGKWSMSLSAATSSAACWIAFPILRSCNQTSHQLLWTVTSEKVRRTETEGHVDSGCCTFQNAKGADDWRWHAVLRLVDLEVLEGAFRLSAPVLVCGDLYLAKGVTLCSCESWHYCGRSECSRI